MDEAHGSVDAIHETMDDAIGLREAMNAIGEVVHSTKSHTLETMDDTNARMDLGPPVGLTMDSSCRHHDRFASSMVSLLTNVTQIS